MIIISRDTCQLLGTYRLQMMTDRRQHNGIFFMKDHYSTDRYLHTAARDLFEEFHSSCPVI